MSVVESAMAGGRKEVALAAIAVLTAVRLWALHRPWVYVVHGHAGHMRSCARLRALKSTSARHLIGTCSAQLALAS